MPLRQFDCQVRAGVGGLPHGRQPVGFRELRIGSESQEHCGGVHAQRPSALQGAVAFRVDGVRKERHVVAHPPCQPDQAIPVRGSPRKRVLKTGAVSMRRPPPTAIPGEHSLTASRRGQGRCGAHFTLAPGAGPGPRGVLVGIRIQTGADAAQQHPSVLLHPADEGDAVALPRLSVRPGRCGGPCLRRASCAGGPRFPLR